jgi:formamidopyrimidine-DNA glycosylase
MPELPEVESIRRALRPHLLGQSVERAFLLRADIARDPDGRTPRASDLLQGATISRLDRHGKNLALIAADGRTICAHLGMTGALTWSPVRPGGVHLHAVWRFSNGWLAFHDPRRFGRLRTFPTPVALRALFRGTLGPDALRVSGCVLGARLSRSRRCVKASLLDQRALAGVGNIYADEALFRARLHPASRCCDLTAAQWCSLGDAIRAVLRRAIRSGGSTIRSYRDALGRNGTFQHEHAVYARAGLPCVSCGTPLKSGRIAQRTTTWCPNCQPVVPPSQSGIRPTYSQ